METKTKLAIIDNNKNILKVINQQLKKEYECCLFTELLSNFFEQSYDLIILDIKLNNHNGLEIAKNIKEKNENQKIIMITGYIDMFEYDLKKYEKYYEKLLLKPITKKLLNKTIQEVLNGMD